MFILYILIFVFSIVFSAFFSSAETSLLSINRIKLNLNAQKKNKKALLLRDILKEPEEFFSTILIGNNFVNIAAASISTVIFARLLSKADEEIILAVSTLATTIIILILAEIIPKSFAFRYSEKMSYTYAYPILFFKYLFFPFVKITSLISSLLFRKSPMAEDKKNLSREEVKHFLASEIKLFKYTPESLRMINEIIDIAERNIKSIMTPRINILALEETAEIEDLLKLMVEQKLSKVPLYKVNLDNITGIVHTDKIIPALMAGGLENAELKDVAVKPIFISEYSSLNYALKEFKRHGLNIAVVLDEYGSAIGILTLNDIFREILGEIKIEHPPIRKSGDNQFILKGSVAVEEVIAKLGLPLPEKKDYATLSGLFIYYNGSFPHEGSKIKIGDIHLQVTKMGKRKIEELILSKDT